MVLRRRTPSIAPRPLITGEDLRLVCELPLLWVLALVRPERTWHRLCYRIESAKARLALSDPATVAAVAMRVLGPSRPSFDARAFAIDVAAGRSEHHMQIMRCRSPAGWTNAPVLRGQSHLDAALAAGRGVVLWVAHFCFNALAAKKALHGAGYPVWHVSRAEHGFSKSTFGIAAFNGFRVRSEQKYLAGRIVYRRDQPAAVTFAALRLLRSNAVLSITAGDWEGGRLAAIDVLGGKVELSIGAPGLARLTGATLLPVFVVRGAPGEAVAVAIEPPLTLAADRDSEDTIQGAARQFGVLLDDYVRRYPAQWRDWSKLKLPA